MLSPFFLRSYAGSAALVDGHSAGMKDAPIMTDCDAYIGPDVHKASISIAMAGAEGRVRFDFRRIRYYNMRSQKGA
jgi:hypothetical protein